MKQTWFVIVTSPPQVASETCYIAQDASPTMMRWNAARFSSFADAQEFAKKNRIALNADTYIDLIIQGRIREDTYDGKSRGIFTSEMETARDRTSCNYPKVELEWNEQGYWMNTAMKTRGGHCRPMAEFSRSAAEPPHAWAERHSATLRLLAGSRRNVEC